MRFAFAGIDFLGDVFQVLVEKGWEPVKLFTRPCDNIYDFNDVTVGRARALKLPIQMSRIRPADLSDLEASGCEALVVAGYPWLITGWEQHLRYAVNFHPSPLPVGRGPYPLFTAILDGAPHWGMSVHALSPTFDTGAIVAQDRFDLSPDETHDMLLAKCQMAAKRLAATLAADFPRLWSEATPQGEGSYWPRITQAQRTLDWTQDVADVLRTVRAFGSIEAIAQVGSTRLYVWQATGWVAAHRLTPGTLVHKHRRHLVMAVRDGLVQLTGWSALAPEVAREAGRSPR
jgi:methionyl-tRNA formyltransferase